jgi:Domain of unknown function (DUF303).
MLCAFLGVFTILPETAEAAKLSMKNTDSQITLKYDDRYTFKKEIKEIKTISVKSDNVQTGGKDSEVLKIQEGSDNKVVAAGCGKAVVELKSGKKIGVTVKAAKISLLLLIGQSNMEGSPDKLGSLEEYQNEYVVNKEGKVYSTYGPSTLSHSLTNGCFQTVSPKLTIWNPDEYVPGSLTDNSSEKEWKRTNNLTDAEQATGKTGVDGALAKEWVKRTDEKVWLVNAAHSGSSIDTWLPGKERINNNFWQAVSLYKTCEQLLNKEIEAGHYKLSHKGYFWLQGETDDNMSAKKYLEKFLKMHNGIKNELGTGRVKKYKNVDQKIEFAGILMVRAHGDPTDNSDLYMTGPRKAQYYMCNSSKEKFKDIYLASHISEDWVTDAGVDLYFKSKYPTIEKYMEFNNMKKQDVEIPSQVEDVHQSVHYTQLGYNELGRDAAANICYALKYVKAPESETQIRLVGTDGYTDITSAVKAKEDDMSVTVKIFPAYKAKSLEVMRKEGISLNRWNVKLQSDNYFSGQVKYMAGGKSRIYTLWSENGASSIQNVMKVPGGIKIDWKKLDKASYYKVFRRVVGTNKWVCIKKTKKNNNISYTDYEAEQGTDYEYMVRAFDKYGTKGKNSISYIAA